MSGFATLLWGLTLAPSPDAGAGCQTTAECLQLGTTLEASDRAAAAEAFEAACQLGDARGCSHAALLLPNRRQDFARIQCEMGDDSACAVWWHARLRQGHELDGPSLVRLRSACSRRVPGACSVVGESQVRQADSLSRWRGRSLMRRDCERHEVGCSDLLLLPMPRKVTVSGVVAWSAVGVAFAGSVLLSMRAAGRRVDRRQGALAALGGAALLERGYYHAGTHEGFVLLALGLFVLGVGAVIFVRGALRARAKERER